MSADPTRSQLAALMTCGGVALLHVAYIIVHRSSSMAMGKATPTSFGPSRSEPPTSLYGRICASHSNCMENLPLFAIVVCVHALLTVMDTTSPAPIDASAWRYVYFRIGQSAMFCAGYSDGVVTARFMCFLVQIGCLLLMANSIIAVL